MGRNVTTLTSALYGPERDDFIVRAKAVVNAHFYESSRFEQARVAHCLSLGTPVISERTPRTRPHAAFEDCVFWLEGAQLEQFFADDFATPAFYDVARAALERFEHGDPVEPTARPARLRLRLRPRPTTSTGRRRHGSRSASTSARARTTRRVAQLDVLARTEPTSCSISPLPT